MRLTDFESLPTKTVATWEPPNHHIQGLAFAPDGRTLAAASANLGNVFLLECDDAELILRGTLGGTGSIESLAFAPDGSHFAAANRDGPVYLWDLLANVDAPGTALLGHGTPVTSVTFGTGGKVLASADWDGRLILWDVPGRKQKASWEFPGRISSLAFAPDGQYLAVGGATGVVYIMRLSQD